VPGLLLTELADAHALNGNHQHAFEFSRLAILAFQKNHNLEISNRITAVQVSHTTERMRTEAEYLKQLARANAERVEALEQSTGILERLSIIGQEITASLDLDAVFRRSMSMRMNCCM